MGAGLVCYVQDDSTPTMPRHKTATSISGKVSLRTGRKTGLFTIDPLVFLYLEKALRIIYYFTP